MQLKAIDNGILFEIKIGLITASTGLCINKTGPACRYQNGHS